MIGSNLYFFPISAQTMGEASSSYICFGSASIIHYLSVVQLQLQQQQQQQALTASKVKQSQNLTEFLGLFTLPIACSFIYRIPVYLNAHTLTHTRLTCLVVSRTVSESSSIEGFKHFASISERKKFSRLDGKVYVSRCSMLLAAVCDSLEYDTFACYYLAE